MPAQPSPASQASSMSRPRLPGRVWAVPWPLSCPRCWRGQQPSLPPACGGVGGGQELAHDQGSLPMGRLLLIRARAPRCSLSEQPVAFGASLWRVKKPWNDIFLLALEIQVLSGSEISEATGEQGETMTLQEPREWKLSNWEPLAGLPTLMVFLTGFRISDPRKVLEG